MKRMLVAVDNAGRVFLRKHVREKLVINPGDYLRVSVIGNKIALTPNRATSGFVKRGRALVFSTGEPELLDAKIVDFIRRAERDKLDADIGKGISKPKRRRKF
jgi:AbrB family looped-hinge helix DNA binding protein